MEFNTLDAQREACEAYIVSQRSEGWVASPEKYDDGGFSGGALKRPALNRLIDDIKAKKVDVIVVYKIDRLTRSLTDFAKLVDVFDEYGVTFVSVTQSFNTTTSMGRLIAHQSSILAGRLLNEAISKVIVKQGTLVIQICVKAINDLISKTLNLGLLTNSGEETIDLVTTYKTRKAKNGAVVIEPEQYRDPLDIPQNELEKLVQGLVWREEHFGGLTLQMIADKYGHSKSHIHINILKTLEFA